MACAPRRAAQLVRYALRVQQLLSSNHDLRLRSRHVGRVGRRLRAARRELRGRLAGGGRRAALRRGALRGERGPRRVLCDELEQDPLLKGRLGLLATAFLLLPLVLRANPPVVRDGRGGRVRVVLRAAAAAAAAAAHAAIATAGASACTRPARALCTGRRAMHVRTE